jgi:hypothetical protein
MRTVLAELGALHLDLGVTFGAGREIAAKVADPLFIVQETQIATAIAEQYGPVATAKHESKFSFTVENIPLIIWIGGKVTQPDLKLSDVQESMMDAGINAALPIVVRYLGAFFAPMGQEKVETDGETQAGN